MSLKKPAKDQPENFEFNSSSLEEANTIISKCVVEFIKDPIQPLQ